MDDVELIQHYLAGNLTESEREAFEQRMQDDPQWRETVDDYRLIFTGLAELNKASATSESPIDDPIVQKIATWSESLPPITPAPPGPAAPQKNRRQTLRALMLGAGLVLIAGWWWWKNQSPNLQQLVQDLSSSEMLRLELATKGDATENWATAIETTYRNQEYIKCLKLTQTVDASQPNYLAARYVEGLCHFRLGDYSVAQNTLQLAIDRSSQPNYDQRNFNLTKTKFLQLLAKVALYEQKPDAAQKEQIKARIDELNTDPYYAKRLAALKAYFN